MKKRILIVKKNKDFTLLFSDMEYAAASVERFLSESFSAPDDDTDEVVQAMKYSLFAGGKRIRPYIVLSFCRLFGGSEEAGLPFAAAVEMIHTFSLIHDDLPSMDNDDLRRGKPTNHKVFGEATALLAGDALALKAFGVAANNKYVSPATALEAVKALSLASAEMGMVGGQIMDMYGEGHSLSLEKLKKLQELKTGALISVSAYLGCLAAGLMPGDEKIERALEYARGIGLAFQIKDDMLDVMGDEKLLGKPIGSDDANSKTTFLTHMTLSRAGEFAEELTAKAKEAVSSFANSENLRDLADYLLVREK